MTDHQPEDRAAHVEREAVAGVLAAHVLTLHSFLSVIGECECGEWKKSSLREQDVEAAHRLHLADAVLAALPQTGDAAAAFMTPGPEHCPTCGAETAQDQCATRTGRDHPTRRLWGRAYRAGAAAQRAALTAGITQGPAGG